ncbi:MAG: hypothetical protein RL538_170 [Candidatus Parcubacteria bacterium]|jgi:hypothetical protein
MKRWLFIIGILIILILAGAWIFLLLASDETKRDIYNTFGFTGETEDGVVENIIDTLLPGLPPERVPLRQLTTRRVAGYTEVQKASSTPEMYFVEAGTGYVYTLNLQDGSERRLSNITIVGAREARITKDGKYAIVKSGDLETGVATIVKLSEQEVQSSDLFDTVIDFTITDENILLYTTYVGNDVTARSYDPESKATKTLFTVPFNAATILWGEGIDTAHYAYPKTTRELTGHLYKFEDNTIQRVAITGYGLSVMKAEDSLLFSKINDGRYKSFTLQTDSNEQKDMLISFFPEKCAPSKENSFVYCANSTELEDGSFPDAWYRGAVSYSDNIWRFDTRTSDATFVYDTFSAAQREIDVISPFMSDNTMSFYFKNKNDQTLWVYDLTFTDNN